MIDFLFTHTPLFYFVQSFWRDEAFSVIFAQKPLPDLIFKSLMEPPVYYILLHFWIKLFGTSEIAARSLSLFGFFLATIIVIEWSDILFRKHWLSKFTPLFFFLNPMLLYYAFEVRAYGFYILFATASLFAYQQKRWRLYQIAVVLGMYTHLYLGIIPLIHVGYEIISKRLWKKWKTPLILLKNPVIQSIVIIGICFIPWLIRLSTELSKFKDSWYYPVNLNLIQSVLGNMFLGYEGTPWYGWKYTRILSIILLFACIAPLWNKKTRSTAIHFVLIVFVPLLTVIGFSFIKPIFVNRYLIPVTIAEVFLISYALFTIRSLALQKITGIMLIIFVTWFNMWFPQQHPKLNIRKTFTEVNAMKKPGDYIYASNPIIFMETLYYAKDTNKVRLFNPLRSPFPWYIGDAVYSQTFEIQSLPPYPLRAFIIQPDGTYTIGYTTKRSN